MKYSYEAPAWAVRLLCVLALVIASTSFLGFFLWDRWAGDAPMLIRWLLLAMAVVFLLVGLRPRNWKPWRYFYADSEGVHFPSECPASGDTEWLTVPWTRVGRIEIKSFRGNQRGPWMELRLSAAEIDQFFRNLKLAKLILSEEVENSGYFSVGYTNLFQQPDTAVAALRRLKRKH